MLYSERVALMLSHQAYNALISWAASGPRITHASFKTRMEKIQLNTIQCYAPTNDKDEGTKEDFYNKLQTVLDKMKEKDVTTLMGDFNAKIGLNNRGYEEVIGTHGIGEMIENGEMFADLCSFNKLMIGDSEFPHRRIHKATWVSPDHRTENQIDHICISQKFRRSMQDVHRGGADAASDHHLFRRSMHVVIVHRGADAASDHHLFRRSMHVVIVHRGADAASDHHLFRRSMHVVIVHRGADAASDHHLFRRSMHVVIVHRGADAASDHHLFRRSMHVVIVHRGADAASDHHLFRRSMHVVIVHRGADAASDHHLVLTKLNLKLKSTR